MHFPRKEVVSPPFEIYISVMAKEQILNLDFDIRDDGVYLSVPRTSNDASTLSGIIKALEEKGVMNYDSVRIGDVIKRKRGAYERIGDIFKIYNKVKDQFIRVSVNPAEALITVYGTCQTQGVSITYDDIIYVLKKNKVVHGIDHEVIKNLLQGCMFDQAVVVASATLPRNGVDACIEEYVQVDASYKPKVFEGGKCNFKDMDTITQVHENDLLAVKIPASAGTNGTSVFGEPLPASPGQDLPLPGGENTVVSPEGTKLFAQQAGYLYRSEKGIAVGEVYVVNGNVDFSIGNLNYTGKVVIKKNINAGFEVKAGGDVFVSGEIEAARVISKEGSVRVEGGVFGKNTGSVTAARDVEATVVQDAEVFAEGIVRITKNAVNSQITATEGIECNTCIGGELKSYGSITVRMAGNTSLVKTRLTLCDREREKNLLKKKQLDELLRVLDIKIGQQEAGLKQMNKLLSAMGAGQANPKLIVQIKETLETYNAAKKKQEFLKQQLAKILPLTGRRMDFPGRIQIIGTCYPGTEIVILEHRVSIAEVFTKKTIFLENDEIKIV